MRPLNVLDLLDFVRLHWRRIAIWGVGAGLAGYLISFVIPPTYRATAVILPPEEDEFSMSLSIARRNLPGLGGLGRLGSYFTQADIALAILRSRSVHERVARDFDLRRIYGHETWEATIRRLRERVSTKLGTDGTIAVSVEDRSSQRSAELANRFLSELDRYNQQFRSARARRTRLFLERRVLESDSMLRQAEQSLAAYQRRKGAVVLSPEGRASTESAASMMAQKASAEVELELLRGYASSRSDEVRRLEDRVRELRRQVGSLPATQIGGAELLRNVSVQHQVYAFLTAQLEEARIREAMDTPTIQILDPAVPPERRSWPRRSWIAAFGLALGAVAGIADATGRLAFLRSRYRHGGG